MKNTVQILINAIERAENEIKQIIGDIEAAARSRAVSERKVTDLQTQIDEHQTVIKLIGSAEAKPAPVAAPVETPAVVEAKPAQTPAVQSAAIPMQEQSVTPAARPAIDPSQP
jgi:hypothetical protein